MQDRPFDPQNINFLAGGGEMGALIRAKDWSLTTLGPPQNWPQSLRSAVSILLPSKAQIVLFWGRELITLYNDAYRSVFGGKHPRVLGLPAHESWRELWSAGLRELIEGVINTGEAYWASDRPFFMERFGYQYPEETFFDVSYDPVRDETGRVAGVFCIVSETTARVVGERRLKTLRELSARTVEEARSVEDACSVAVRILEGNRHDVPFALIYLLDVEGKNALLTGSVGLSDTSPAAPRCIDTTAKDEVETGWPIAAVLNSNRAEIVTDLSRHFGVLPGGVWPESPHTAVVLPLNAQAQNRLAGLLVVGVSPRRPLDDEYRGFLDILANQISTSIANARSYEEERKRAEALTELDRAKTAFFSNVSHEFRTPLTLMLGPLEDALVNVHGILPLGAARDLDVSRRNALRLLKLVNTMLDFSRIEAGRIQASYVPTDLPTFTAELASNFRSACEKAGLKFVVDCPPFSRDKRVYVDRDMWEKIVLNLLSNALKFTLNGEIAVHLQAIDGHAHLTVRDTGVGIPSEELPRMFERFHRIEHSRGRTHEGTGIGLALVQELVKLHGGAVRVDSIFSEGSTFTVRIPFGTAHLDPQRIGTHSELPSTAIGSPVFVEEALRWLPDSSLDARPSSFVEKEVGVQESSVRPSEVLRVTNDASRAIRPRVLLADDNADMREYVSRLLLGRFEVQAVADGHAALDAARADPPDVILTDVMMPRLDGFGLLRALRENPTTAAIPVIMLSARAGEESRIEGVQAGADDYLIKPFSARELVARVETHVKMARMRRQVNNELEVRVRERTKELEASQERLRALATELNLTEQRERKRVAAELHDHLQQTLVLGKLKVGQGKRFGAGIPAVAKILDETDAVFSDALQYTRTLVAELSPPVLRDNGLVAGLKWLGESMRDKHGMVVTVTMSDDSRLRLPEDQTLLMFQSVRELLINSWKYAGTGAVAVSLGHSDGVLRITVSDDGAGFDLAAALAGTSSGTVSSKFGLFSIRERMKALGGSFEVHSGPGQGTKATLVLPLAYEDAEGRPVLNAEASRKEPQGQQKYAHDSARHEGPSIRVLLVDDHKMVRQGLRTILDGYADINVVGEAINGEEAVALVDQLYPDVVVMDLNMPKMNGVEATRLIKASHAQVQIVGFRSIWMERRIPL